MRTAVTLAFTGVAGARPSVQNVLGKNKKKNKKKEQKKWFSFAGKVWSMIVLTYYVQYGLTSVRKIDVWLCVILGLYICWYDV